MKLYEVAASLEQLEFVDKETGEVNLEMLEQLKMTFNEKSENIIKFIKNLNADIISLKTEEKALQERRKAKENKVEYLKEYLKTTMLQVGSNKLEFTAGIASFRSSKSIECESEFVNWAKEKNAELLTYKEPEPNKTKIKELLENGGELEFVNLVEKQNLQIK